MRNEPALGIDHLGDAAIDPIKSRKERERLCLALGVAWDRKNSSKYWEDSEESAPEDQLTEVLVSMLIKAELCYRDGSARHRDWIIEHKAAAEAELKRQKEEAELRR